ncbi:MAG: DinB family protein [Alphaproteobacteria bacterium]
MSGLQQDDAVRVYWQPGCTSCMRTKEFLTKRGVPFISRNILADKDAMAELARFGLKRIPIVTKGDRWADGQVLADVVDLLKLPAVDMTMLPPDEMHRRIQAVLAGTQRFLAQLPEAELDTLQPNRPRSYRDLVFHIFNIVDAFLEHDFGIALTFESYNRDAGPVLTSKTALAGYGRRVQAGIDGWFAAKGATADWSAPADVYYGKQTLHEFLERTTWHSGQHSRQLMWALEGLGIEPEGRLGAETFGGLPMPETVWEADLAAA